MLVTKLKYFLYFSALFGLLVLTIGCGADSSSEESIGKVDSSQLRMAESERTPALPQDYFSKLKTRADYVDYIFYDYPISFSQTEVPGIRQVVDFIDRESTTMPENCTPSAMVAFLSEGEILAEGDIYFLDGCSYFVFFDENRTPTYSHRLSQSGANYFNNVLKQYFETVQQQSR